MNSMRGQKKQVKIGILAINQNHNSILEVSTTYRKYFEKFGKVQIISCLNPNVYNVDLLVLPGGADVNPVSYLAPPSPYVGSPNLAYEWFDKVMLPKYIAHKIPIFGICRGLICSPAA